MPFVSVIIPAYNAEKTLSVTMGDVLAQTYNDFEIILVDDGSTDGTAAMCDSFTDFRIKVIHQENGGLSNARNNGNKAASGDYVIYVDSDDRIEPYCLEFLVNALKSTGADMACGDVDRVREEYELTAFAISPKVEILGTEEALGEMLTERKVHIGSWCRLIPREWALEEPFLEGKYYEDLSNTYRINIKARKIAVVENVLYHYVMRGGSITGRKTTTVKQCVDYYEAVNLCAKGSLEVFPRLTADAAVMQSRDYMSLFLHIERCPDKELRLKQIRAEVLEWMKKNWLIAFRNRKPKKSVRLRILLFAVSPRLYKKLYYIGINFIGKKVS